MPPKKPAAPQEVRAKVREINALTRTARMNQMYYARRLRRYKSIMRAADLIIGIGSSSAIAGWGLWKWGNVSPTVWAVLSGIGPVLMLIKSTFALPREVERYSKLHIGYCGLYLDLEQLTTDLRLNHELTPERWKTFEQIRKRNKELGLIDDTDAERDDKLLNRCWAEVMQEIPKGSLWLPKTTELTDGETHGD